ncbi:MAG TPA: hypothetical protein VGD54_06960 [Steroidobacteraceae bacterium]
MRPGLIRDWMGPTLGAALAVVGAGGLAYKVISGYRHASPEHFVSVQDQNRQPAASAAEPLVEAPTVSVAASAAPTTAATPVAPQDALQNASSVAVDLPDEAQENSACAAIKTERREIEAALSKEYSAEESRYMQRRLRELAGQSIKGKCGE